VLRSYWSIAVDNKRTTVVVSVSVVVTFLPDNSRFAMTSAVPIPKVFTITVTMTCAHGHASGAWSEDPRCTIVERQPGQNSSLRLRELVTNRLGCVDLFIAPSI